MPTIRIVTLGCKVNRVESDAFAAELHRTGYSLTNDPGSTDAVIVNTCTVTGEADAKVRKVVRRALRESPSAPIVVTGCAASIDPDGLAALDPRVVIEVDKARVVPQVASLIGSTTVAERSEPAPQRERTRVPVKIQDGCDNACTYCIIHIARGEQRSEPTDSVLDAVRSAVTAGAREIVLTGINLGAYSTPEAPDLASLLRLLDATGIDRIRLSSIEPQDVTTSLIDALASLPSVMPHLHVPVQSGSDAILTSMGRHYSSEEYRHLADRLMGAIDGLTLTTDVIVGFPGETEEDFSRTMDLVDSIGFTKVHVFRYSPRPGTPAAGFQQQVGASTRSERAARLSELAERLRLEAIDQAEAPFSVLVEQESEGIASGTSERYFKIVFRAPEGVRVGDVVEVREALSIR